MCVTVFRNVNARVTGGGMVCCHPAGTLMDDDDTHYAEVHQHTCASLVYHNAFSCPHRLAACR